MGFILRRLFIDAGGADGWRRYRGGLPRGRVLLLLTEFVYYCGFSLRGWLRHVCIHISHTCRLILHDRLSDHRVVRVTQLILTMRKPTILPEFAVTCFFKQTAHDCLVVAVGHGIVVFLLFIYFVHVVIWERVAILSQLMVPMGKVASAAALAAKSFYEVHTNWSFEFLVELRKTGLDLTFHLKVVYVHWLILLLGASLVFIRSSTPFTWFLTAFAWSTTTPAALTSLSTCLSFTAAWMFTVFPQLASSCVLVISVCHFVYNRWKLVSSLKF